MANNTLPDFDTLKYLYEQSPEKVEEILRDNIALIFNEASGDNLRRLKGLQFHIDAQRELSKNPIDSCVRISRMMHNTFSELDELLNDFQHLRK